MNLTHDAAAMAAQLIPLLALGVIASFGWLSRGPLRVRGKSRRKRRPKQTDHLDVFLWFVFATICVVYALSAADATTICFDVLQGNPVRENAATYVRNVLISGLMLLIALPAVNLLILPMVEYVGLRVGVEKRSSTRPEN